MTKRSQRISRIARVSMTAEQLAAQALAQARQEVARLSAQRHELQRYQSDYLRRLDGSLPDALPSYEAQKLRLFVQRIEQAIQSLDHQILLAGRRCERERQRWLGQHRRVNALDEVANRARLGEERAAEARLQREIDDRGRRSS
jgi:flagellar export protein FliJ